MKAFFRKIFGTKNERDLKAMRPIIQAINDLEPSFQAMTDDELRGSTARFRARLAAGETLDDILPEAFAACREASVRTTGMRHYDVQMIGGIALHRGMIAEMKTGEGKTLVATSALFLNALEPDPTNPERGMGAHLVTVNDYLAKRDSEWMGKIYNALGMSVGVIVHGLSDRQRQDAYGADITYGTNNEFGFDYLRDNMKFSLDSMVHRYYDYPKKKDQVKTMHYAIVDEVDSILIDEARTPLIISGPAEESSEVYYTVNAIVPSLRRDEDFIVDEKSSAVTLTESGVDKVEKRLSVRNLYDGDNVELVHHVYQALKAHTLFKRDVNYVIEDGGVVIVDEFTGRKMPGRRWSDGLHQAVEAKEGLKIENENQTLATITFQNLFRMYNKLAGMTGTADTEAEEFARIYDLDVLVVPTNRPTGRTDHEDFVYKNDRAKFMAVLDQIKECYGRGQPVLVGTTSVEKSELVSRLLTRDKIPHHVLNAKNHGLEAQIIAQAGRKFAVTISTNMAGRGTDIVLGGNPEALARTQVDSDESDKYQELVEQYKPICTAERPEVLAAGGLFIIGTERHESRRIDNQLRGRSGRQGDPGSSRFYLSLDDALMRIFAGDRVRAIMDRLKMPEGEAIEAGIVTRSIESAQRKVEARNFDMRKQLLEYDDVSNDQRKVIYQQRNAILDAQDLSAQISSLREGCFQDLVRQYVPAESVEEQWDIAALQKVLTDDWQIDLPLQKQVSEASAITDDDLLTTVIEAANASFQSKLDQVGAEHFTQFERMVLLQSIDTHWRDHLSALDYLRQGIHLRGYAQKQPKQEYKREAFELFGQLLDSVKNEVTKVLMTVKIQSNEQLDQAAEDMEARGESIANVTYSAPTETGEVETMVDKSTVQASASDVPRVGRNDPCPCGSGKKYKQCHGKLA